MRRNRHLKAFTLIELLVVVGIISVLVAILLPIVAAVVRNSRAAICASNERQMLAAAFAYTGANNGYLPLPDGAWTGSDGLADFKNGSLLPYIGDSIQTRAQVMHCPADSLEQLCSYGGVDVQQPPYRNFSYSLNITMRNANTTCGIKLTQVKNAAAHVMVYEEFAPNDSLCYGPGDLDDWLTGRHGGPGTVEHRSAYQNSNWRMDGRGNVGYFDGHVGIMSVNTYFGTTYHFSPLTQ